MSAPLAAQPTLIIVPSFSVSAEPPALASIPGSAATALSALVDQGSAITAEENSVADAVQFPLSSFIDDADGEPDADLEEFFNPPLSKKGKAKAAGPAPTPPPIASTKKASTATPTSPAVAGPSSTLHAHLKSIGFTPIDKPTTRFTTKEHLLAQRNVEAVGHGQTILDDRISAMQHDMAMGFEGVEARLVGMAADHLETANGSNALTTSTLIAASNKHTANTTAMSTAINDAYVRIRQVEEAAAAITSLTATVGQLSTTFQAVLRQLSASTGTATPAMSGDDAALINAALNPNGKRAREEDDDSAKRQHLETGVNLPDSFVPPPPGPVFAAPAFAPAAPAAPVYAAPVHAIAAVAAPTALVLPTPPAAPIYAAAAGGYVAPAYVAPIAPGALPRPPPAGPPRVRPDPTREVQFGPMDWQRNFTQFPRNLISNVLTTTMYRVRYTSRRGADDATAILVFEADTIATWFIHTWNNHARPGWNINGAFSLQMSCPDFRKDLERYDINLFQETHLRPQQHESIEVSQGYSLVSRTRRPKASFDKSWGGNAAVIRSYIPFKYNEHYSGPDSMAIQINNLLIYNVYLLPESSQWAGALEKDPCDALAASLALAYNAGFEVTLHGDLNARTASLLAYPTDPPRKSLDIVEPSTRGKWLCNMLGDY
ncbi:hypothetical protein C8R44DRAFT_905282 [Mycena epipterygia]|nr:hypothetical protein C8R44DRAFT_905282 [Mycena epipterygia]